MTVEASTGFAAVPTWMVRDTARISKHALLVYVALAHRVDEFGEAWPSIATLAMEARCSRTSAKAALDELEKLEILSRRRTQRDDGGWGHNVYRVSVGMRSGQLVRPTVSRRPGVGQQATDTRSTGGHEVHPVEVHPVEVEGDALFEHDTPSSKDDIDWIPSGIARFDRDDVSDELPATSGQIEYLQRMHETCGIGHPADAAEFASLTRQRASDRIQDLQGLYRSELRKQKAS